MYVGFALVKAALSHLEKRASRPVVFLVHQHREPGPVRHELPIAKHRSAISPNVDETVSYEAMEISAHRGDLFIPNWKFRLRTH